MIDYFTTFGRVEFLSRELGWFFKGIPPYQPPQHSTSEHSSSTNVQVVLVGNSEEEVENLKTSSLHSFFVFLYGDETYNKKSSRLILLNPKVKGIIRCYPLYEREDLCGHILQNLRVILRSLSRFRLEEAKFSIAGLVMIYRQISISNLHSKFRKPSLQIPLGYTNIFADTFLKFFGNYLVEDQSIYELERSKFSEKFEKTYDVAFVGQLGTFVRRKFIEESSHFLEQAFGQSLDNKIVLRSRFGGVENCEQSNGWTSEYIEIMSCSRVTLCPPGNYSGQTFRYAEALALYCFPLEIDRCLTDPLWKPQVALGIGPEGDWTFRLSGFLHADELAAKELVDAMRAKFRGDMASVNDKILGSPR